MKLTLTRALRQNNCKNVWICPALCNHKGMSWDISAFPLQDPSFPTARPGLENLFPLSLSLSLSLSLPPYFLPSSLSLSVCGDTRIPQRPVYRRITIQAQCLQECKEQESVPSEKPLGRTVQAKVVSYFQRKSNGRFMETNTQHSSVEWPN